MDVDVLIIGAGLAGASTAYHLRRRCDTEGRDVRVLVVDKEPQPGVHSSGRNAALVRLHTDDPAIAEVTRQGARRIIDEHLAPFRRTGSMLIGLGDDDVSGRFPLAQGRGRWCPDDGVVDVAALLSTYLTGGAVQYDTEVTGWEDAGDDTRSETSNRTAVRPRAPEHAVPTGSPADRHAVAGAGCGRPRDVRGRLRVHTTRGTITTGMVVNAAGPWAGVLGRLPLRPMNRHLFVTTPVGGVGRDWPFVWHMRDGLYFRPESGGLLLCACDEIPAEPGVYEEDPDVAGRLATLVQTHQPGLAALRIMRCWVGQRTFAPDRRFVIGYDARDRRVFHVAGLGGHGVATSPAIGAIAADMLLRPGRIATPAAFDPARLLP